MLDAAVYQGLLEKAVAELDFEVPKQVVAFAAEQLSETTPGFRTYSQLDKLLDQFADDCSLATMGSSNYKELDKLLLYHSFWHAEFYAQVDPAAVQQLSIDTRGALRYGLSTLELPKAGPRQWIYHNFEAFEEVLARARELYDAGVHLEIIQDYQEWETLEEESNRILEANKYELIQPPLQVSVDEEFTALIYRP